MSVPASKSAGGGRRTTVVDYEIMNKKVRQYRTNDSDTVRTAVAEHMRDFLEYHAVPEYHGFEYLRWFLSVAIIAAGLFSYVYKHPVFLDNRPVYAASATAFAFFSAIQYYVDRWLEGRNTLFIARPMTAKPPAKALDAFEVTLEAPEPEALETDATEEAAKAEEAEAEGDDSAAVFETLPDEALPEVVRRVNGHATAHAKSLRELLTARYVRFRIEMNDTRPILQLHADWLESNGWYFWSRPTVRATVSHPYPFARFFDADGFVFPPAVKEATMRLLAELSRSAPAPAAGSKARQSEKKRK